MMEIEKLIERLNDWDGVDAIYNGEFVEVNSHGVYLLLEEAIAALEHLQAENERLKAQVPRWIPVEERLPEPNTGDDYWVAKKGPRGNTIMKLAQYSDYGMAMSIDASTDVTWRDWDFTKITDVTHWMPLPEPPKDGTNGKH